MRVARSNHTTPGVDPPSPRPYSPDNIPYVDDDYSEDYVPPTSKPKPNPAAKDKKPAKRAVVNKVAAKKAAKSRPVIDSGSESEAEEPRSKVSRVNSVSSAEESNNKVAGNNKTTAGNNKTIAGNNKTIAGNNKTISGKPTSKPVLTAKQIRKQLAGNSSYC